MKILNTLDNCQEVDVCFNEFGNMFSLESNWEVDAYCCARHLEAEPNRCWLLMEFLPMFVEAGIVTPVANVEDEKCDESALGSAVYCDIIHPEFNDGGYSLFGDFCRSRLGQQCQYGSRYIEGRIEGYPALGEGLRFNNGKGHNGGTRPLNSGDYHSIRIHRDDMDEFERRYKAFCEERLR
jgi:hypothetical protein